MHFHINDNIFYTTSTVNCTFKYTIKYCQHQGRVADANASATLMNSAIHERIPNATLCRSNAPFEGLSLVTKYVYAILILSL